MFLDSVNVTSASCIIPYTVLLKNSWRYCSCLFSLGCLITIHSGVFFSNNNCGLNWHTRTECVNACAFISVMLCGNLQALAKIFLKHHRLSFFKKENCTIFNFCKFSSFVCYMLWNLFFIFKDSGAYS